MSKLNLQGDDGGGGLFDWCRALCLGVGELGVKGGSSTPGYPQCITPPLLFLFFISLAWFWVCMQIFYFFKFNCMTEDDDDDEDHRRGRVPL